VFADARGAVVRAVSQPLRRTGPLGSTTKMRGEDALLPQGLRKLGYRTHISGKWHIGETVEHRPLGYGFDTSYGYLRGQIDPYTHRYKFGDHVTWHRNDQFVEERGHVTDLITEEAIRVIDSAGAEPFFLYVAHHSPHYPLNEPPRWIAPYEKTIDDVWRRHFAAAVTHVDDGVRQIVEALEQKGLRENTLIVFSSDNGGQQSWSAPQGEYNGRYAAHTTLGNNDPLRGWKGDLYEGGIRVPALLNWPGRIPAGRVFETPTHVVDWLPTLIRAAGGDPADNQAAEGIDLWAALLGQSPPLPERVMYWKTPCRFGRPARRLEADPPSPQRPPRIVPSEKRPAGTARPGRRRARAGCLVIDPSRQDGRRRPVAGFVRIPTPRSLPPSTDVHNRQSTSHGEPASEGNQANPAAAGRKWSAAGLDYLPGGIFP
jgi:arylsulfatase A-like enzyme